MLYLLNSDQLLYYDLEHFMDSLAQQETGDKLYTLYAYSVDDIFSKAKRRIALRGKQATDGQGGNMLERYALTDDERDEFLDFLRQESVKVFKAISGYSKTINAAFRFNVDFGDPLSSGNVSSISEDGLTISNAGAEMTLDEYVDKYIIITSAGIQQNESRKIISNTEETITFGTVFSGDVTDMEFVITNTPAKYILIYTLCDATKFETNLFEMIDAHFEKAFVGGILKEWYLLNRFMDDWTIENETLKNTIIELRSSFFQQVSTKRTFNNIF